MALTSFETSDDAFRQAVTLLAPLTNEFSMKEIMFGDTETLKAAIKTAKLCLGIS